MKTGKAPGACEDGFEGEVEDYDISLGAQSSVAEKAATPGSFEDEDPEPEFLVYPNPTRNFVHLQLSQFTENSICTIYSLTGKKIMEKEIVQNKDQIDLSGQPSGIYILTVQSTAQNFTKKIIKK